MATEDPNPNELTTQQVDKLAGAFVQDVAIRNGMSVIEARTNESLSLLLPTARKAVTNLHPFFQQLLWRGFQAAQENEFGGGA